MRGEGEKAWDWISFILACFCIFLLLAPSGALGAVKSVRSTVFGILTGSSYSGCMAQVSSFANTTGLNCPASSGSSKVWVLLDCQGRWMQRQDAANSLRQAQIAQLIGSRVTLTIDDSKRVGGYCLAKQVILFR